MPVDAVARLKAIINDVGITATYTVVTEGTYNPTTGQNSGGSTTAYSVKCVVRDYNALELGSDFIQQGDRKVYLAALSLDFTPTEGDTMTINGRRVRVIRVEEMYHRASVQVYRLQVRGL